MTEWTCIVDIAADNNLTTRVFSDLSELATADDASVGVIVQVDQPKIDTFRYRLRKHLLVAVQQIPNVDSGSPQVLTDFLTWSKAAFPSKRYAVVLWSHGNGWPDFKFDEPDIQKLLDMLKVRRPALHNAIAFNIEALNPDVSAHDFLSNSGLRDALKAAMGADGKFAVLGCDACLMAMVEVAYEIREAAEVFVASQADEELAGWPYDDILKIFKDGLSPEDAGSGIVRAARNASAPVPTLSAVRLGSMDALAAALEKLGSALVAILPQEMPRISATRDKSDYFTAFAYIDLRNFVVNLKTDLSDQTALVKAADEVIKRIDDAVIAPGPGDVKDAAFGISAYIPKVKFDPDSNGYSALSLCSVAPNWAKFVIDFATQHK